MSIQIGRRVIAPGQKPFIVAEVGSNWHSLDDCLRSIEAAKRCGADAVKFQAFTFQALYGLGKGHTPATYNKKYELPLEWFPQLKNKADNCGVEFMCTAFDPETMQAVDQYVNVHKIASSDLNYSDLLNRAGRLRKPVFASTGGASEREVTLALSALSGCQVVMLYCVAAYPAPYTNLFAMDALRKVTPLIGFSDHTLDPIYTPLSAYKNHGAVVIEKHFTCVGRDTPDGYHSLDEKDFATMCAYLSGQKETHLAPLECERDMLLKHKRRLVATKDIKEGERFVVGENFGVYRSLVADTAGLSPLTLKDVNGSTAKMKLDAGQPVSVLHVQL